ncbi:MAG: hypothetical protein JNL41_14230 [Phenylobacterium sp.]|uniref:hypothetical protein n=1 Tax=Phenylobacterium sp. TaxID=1871053 RepID=UPI001A5F2571|nr:hypothetical protein [Phenylobacterium sp.]MBL8555428.1 hypothetical protein [Phenylobacterium sp.]
MSSLGSPAPGRPLRVCFFFNAQRHQMLHGVSTAVQLARTPGFEAHLLSPCPEHVAYGRRLVERLGGAPVVFSTVSPGLLSALRQATGASSPPKLVSLALLARRLSGFDAIAVPERTSILLRRLGVRGPLFVHLDHGAGDRAAGFDPRIREFDFVLMAGEKHRERLTREGLIRDGAYAVAGYPKFDAADAIRDPDWRPFDDRRPTVLYNPHFSGLGSWAAFGERVIAAFAGQARYNLIVAPHVRMTDGRARQALWRELAARYAGCRHIHFDTGSDRCIDMTYTTLADVYLGDVSSQVYEFLRTPRPCVFLDAHGVDWAADENYSHWRFGPVVTDPAALVETVDSAVAGHWRFLAPQIEGFAGTFDTAAEPASARAAEAIAGFVAQERGGRRPAPARGRGWRQAAALTVAAGAGWMANAALEKAPAPLAEARGFVDEAVTSHRTTLIRAAMKSQPEVREFDPAEIRAATGLSVPRLPSTLLLADVQIFPSNRGPIVQIAAATDRGEPISFVAMRMDTPAGAKPILETYKGERVVYWEDRGQAFGVVGAIPAERLLRLAAELAPGERIARRSRKES